MFMFIWNLLWPTSKVLYCVFLRANLLAHSQSSFIEVQNNNKLLAEL